MTLGTPNESYDPEAASFMLKGVGEQYVKIASTDLLDRGVLSKLVRDPSKPKPGRTLRISEAYVLGMGQDLFVKLTNEYRSNQNALGGSIPRDLFQDAAALEELLAQQEDNTDWREWSLLAADGDAAALIELVSEDKV